MSTAGRHRVSPHGLPGRRSGDEEGVSTVDEDKHTEKDEPKGGRPGPVDHGRDGGMATRENAPELAEESDTVDTD